MWGSRTAAVAIIVVAVGGAAAHVTCRPNQAPPGTYFTTAFQVPHGCDGSPTKQLQMKIPEGVTHVKPRRAFPGWPLIITYRDNNATLAASLGENKTVTSITWTAATAADYIADMEFEVFEVTMKLPQKAEGDAVYFPVVQFCANSTAPWTYVGPTPPQGEKPAPKVSLVNATSTTPTAAKNDGSRASVAAVLSTVLPAIIAAFCFL